MDWFYTKIYVYFGFKSSAQRHITARMYIAALLGRAGLRGAAARRSATWPLALVGLGATSHTCDTLCAIALLSRLFRNYSGCPYECSIRPFVLHRASSCLRLSFLFGDTVVYLWSSY